MKFFTVMFIALSLFFLDVGLAQESTPTPGNDDGPPPCYITYYPPCATFVDFPQVPQNNLCPSGCTSRMANGVKVYVCIHNSKAYTKNENVQRAVETSDPGQEEKRPTFNKNCSITYTCDCTWFVGDPAPVNCGTTGNPQDGSPIAQTFAAGIVCNVTPTEQ